VSPGAALRTARRVECDRLRPSADLPGRTKQGGNLAGTDAACWADTVATPEGTVVPVGWRTVSGRGCRPGDTDGSVPATPALDAQARAPGRSSAAAIPAGARARSAGIAGERTRKAQPLRDPGSVTFSLGARDQNRLSKTG